ncbi:hypothetical protein CH373_18395 [Leptospira perolatii]|uniref:Uncharacterized protein n=1 Tax=Leptospira perolatii TaxID=2023191 RepID=A0A2M9ZHW1_9LEPT|nr:hypothetical protein [Leptospira perolatii]PJZ68014.1 hypothetical protein CH360_18405 [Leptospira perolatii]PJZ71645.1 hypothetical protein CH373_18395 [Leptospira perolatii]
MISVGKSILRLSLIALALVNCERFEIKIATEDSRLFQYYGHVYGKPKVAEIGHIYPRFPLPVTSDTLPDGAKVDRLFGDMYGHQVFTFATNLDDTSRKTEIVIFKIFYHNIEEDQLSSSSPMKIILYNEETAVIYAVLRLFRKVKKDKYRGKKLKEVPLEEREYPHDRYWICNVEQNQEKLKFTNCLFGDRRGQATTRDITNLYYPFAPIVEDLSKDSSFQLGCSRFVNSAKIKCDFEGYELFGLPVSRSSIWKEWP